MVVIGGLHVKIIRMKNQDYEKVGPSGKKYDKTKN